MWANFTAIEWRNKGKETVAFHFGSSIRGANVSVGVTHIASCTLAVAISADAMLQEFGETPVGMWRWMEGRGDVDLEEFREGNTSINDQPRSPTMIRLCPQDFTKASNPAGRNLFRTR